MTYDIAIVGLGPIGSGALRHAALAGARAVGIGPAEPVTWAHHDGPFASHYDSGRITRLVDDRMEWAVLAARSIEQYQAIEAAAGIEFHHPVGCAFVRNDETGLELTRDVVAALDLTVEFMSAEDLHRWLPEVSFPAGWAVVYDPPPAGFIDPRRMVAAQLAAAKRCGADVVRNVVVALDRDGSGYRVGCSDGTEIRAEVVVIATGPYGNDLLPEPLAFLVAPEAIVLGEVGRSVAPRLAELPALIYFLDHPDHDDAYVVPATRYPDGKHYLKLGAAHARAGVLRTTAEKHAWMSGDAAEDQLDSMRGILQGIFPSVDFLGFTMKPCLISDTLHGLPFLDQVADGLYVAVGGNGRAAKSSDAIGKLGADLALNGTWTDQELDQAAFRAEYGVLEPMPGSRHVR